MQFINSAARGPLTDHVGPAGDQPDSPSQHASPASSVCVAFPRPFSPPTRWRRIPRVPPPANRANKQLSPNRELRAHRSAPAHRRTHRVNTRHGEQRLSLRRVKGCHCAISGPGVVRLCFRFVVGESRHRAHTESQREESGESQFLGSLWIPCTYVLSLFSLPVALPMSFSFLRCKT